MLTALQYATFWLTSHRTQTLRRKLRTEKGRGNQDKLRAMYITVVW